MTTRSENQAGGSRNWPFWFLIAASIVVPLTALAILGWVTYRSSESDARQTIQSSATVLREHALKVFETIGLVGSSLEELISDRGDEDVRADPDVGRLARRMLRQLEQVQSIWILNASGELLVSAGAEFDPGSDPGELEYVTALRSLPAQSEYISRVFAAPPGGDPYFVLARAMVVDGTFRGVIATAVNSRYFADVYAQLSAESELIAGLVRSDGSVLAIHPFSDVDLSVTPPVENFAEIIRSLPSSGTYTVPTSGGDDWLIAFHRVGTHQLYVAAALSLAAVHSGWLAQIGRVAAATIPLVAALLVLSIIALRRTQREGEALARLREETKRREATEDQLRQANKMEAVGQLSGGIAHDFNNLLTAIGGNLELLGRKLPEDQAALQRYVEAGREGVRRAASLTHRLLAFSRRQALQPTEVNPNRLLSSMSDLLQRTLGEQIDVEIVLGSGIWPVFADANQLENAVLNLAINARDAMKEGGRLTIETANAHIDDGYLAREALQDVKAGQYVMIAVTDTGTGMPPEVIARAFDPFFTTKAVGEGTGLGLSMVYGFVKQSGGHAKIYSEEGHGTTIRLYLPRATGAGQREERSDDTSRVAEGKGETILVVEDDPGVLAFEIETLTHAGYRVREARNGREAIAALDAEGPIDLLFTDVVLAEGINGRAVADRAQRVRPGIRILFATGYTQNAIVHQGRLDPGVNLLSKPFTASELLRAIRRLLAEDGR